MTLNAKLKKQLTLLFFPILIIYYEIVLKVSIFGDIFNAGLLNMIMFSIPIGLVLYIISTSFGVRTNKIIMILFVLFLTFYYEAEYIYFKIFSTFASLYFFIGAGKATQFSDVLFNAIYKNLFQIIILLLPLILIVIFYKKVTLNKSNKIFKLKLLGIAFIIHIFVIGIIQTSNGGSLNSKYLYSETFIIDKSINRFGLLTTGRLDMKNILSSYNYKPHSNIAKINNENNNELSKESLAKKEAKVEENSNVEHKEAKYNLTNISLDKLAENETSAEIKDMHQYFSNIKPTNENEYTGMFKGKNLILITAEGFSPYAINKDITPTLYKMQEEGFKFTEFYTPLWGVSTSDGEYVICTGILPKSGIWSFYRSAQNYMPYCLGNQLNNLGYTSYAYHNHYFDYYFRDKSHPNMGYSYKGLGNGLNVTETWPESDLEMIDLTVPEFIDTQPFHVYYMTVSGHLQYNFEGNYISYKNKEVVDNLDYSENVKAYLSCNIELDKAMESLIYNLEQAGIAEDTLIAISPDHYPYGLSNDQISELAGHQVESEYELYKSVFLLWSKDMKAETIDKPCSSLDILPTISNLMGLNYDSRLLMGRDIFSDSEPLVIFSNRSWITDKVYYNAETEEIKVREGFETNYEYIDRISAEVKNRFKYSAEILENDYYRLLFDD
ncbi:LTA synthase family protein [Sedimentibacter sp. MB31-C6]|nr:LTA synthase family protein [Sedimentibacter sp. MB36-C1]WSI02965.1 LTA synthase family protein [Sedimentibacter sp. MB36-C1]